MADLPILNAAEPTEIPAKVYDRVWVSEVVIRAPDPNQDIIGEVKLHKYGMFDEKAELDPKGGSWIRVDNMLAKSDEDTDLQAAMASIMAYVGKIGVENNIITPPSA